MPSHCTHPNLRPAFLDQTLGVYCPDCQAVQGCWEDMHVSEALWDLAVPHAVEPGAIPSKLSRPLPEVIHTNPFSGRKIFLVHTTCTWKKMTYPTKTNSPMELTEDILEEMLAAFEAGYDTFHAPW